MLLFHGDAATSAVEDAAVSYQAPSIIAAGANAQTVSLLAMLVNLSLSLICIKAPAIIERLGLTKKGAYTLAFLNLCTWVPLTMAFLISNLGITPMWIAILWLINIMPGILLTFQRDNWLSNLVPQDTLGRYLGQRLAIRSAFYLGAFCSLGYLLDAFGEKNLTSFGIVFTLATSAVLIYYLIFTLMYEPKIKTVSLPKPITPKSRFGLFDYLGELKAKKLDSFIVFSSLFYLSVGLSGPLYAVFMLQERHFSYMSFTLIISAEYLARIISAPFWGRFADKEGNIRVLSIVSRIIPLLPICWLFCSNIGYLAFVQILSGTCWGAFDLCTQSYLYKVAPQPKKLRYIVYTRCLILFSTAMGGLLGAICVNDIFPTFGSKILTVFWLSGFTRIIVVVFLMPKLVDLAMSFAKTTSPPEIDLETLNRVLASKRGQFYRREKQTADAMAQLQHIQEKVTSDINRYAGNRKWIKQEKTRPVISEPIPGIELANSSLHLSHYHEAMAARAIPKPVIIHHHRIEQNAERLKLRYDLECQLKTLTAHAEEAMTHHGIEENVERLKQRYHFNPQVETVAAMTKKAVTHHRIEQNIERLKTRYDFNPQPVTAVAFAEKIPFKAHQEERIDMEKLNSSKGLYRDKVSWTKYMKDTFEAALRERRQGQPVPVIVGSYSKIDIPERIRINNLHLRSNYRNSPVLL